jgi:hypothetical protein
MEKMTINIHLDVTTDGTRRDAIKDVRHMLDVEDGDEYNLTSINELKIDGEDEKDF